MNPRPPGEPPDEMIDRWLTAIGRAAASDSPPTGGCDPERALTPAMRVLSRRRLLRRSGSMAMLAGAYAAGLATMLAWRSPSIGPGAAEVRPGPAGQVAVAADESPMAHRNVPAAADDVAAAKAAATAGAAKNKSVATTESADRPNADEPPLPPGVVDPRTWSRLAKEENLTPFARLMRAGELQFYRHGDIAAATRFYCEALRFATPEQLAVADRDNWLLMTLKQARLREVKHGTERNAADGET